MTQSKKSLWTFSLAFLAFESLCVAVICQFSRLEQMTWVNAHHADWADYLFRFLTALAEIFLPIALAVLVPIMGILYPLALMAIVSQKVEAIKND